MEQLTQPVLFDFAETTTGAVELFPSVWSAAEDLTASEAAVRSDALDRLLELNAPRLSPLVAYLFATRLSDPDLAVRTRVVAALAQVLSPDSKGRLAPDQVVSTLTANLSRLRTCVILDVLETAVQSPKLEEAAAKLLNACHSAGVPLADLVADRRLDMPLRIAAARLIGRVGYLDAFAQLEKVEARLAARVAGQQSMPFAPPPGPDESDLLPVVRKALASLKK